MGGGGMVMALIASQIIGIAVLGWMLLYMLFLYAALRDQEREAGGEDVPRSMSHRVPRSMRRPR